MLDRSIPFYNVILKCDNYRDKEIDDFASVNEAEEYFISQYGQNADDF